MDAAQFQAVMQLAAEESAKQIAILQQGHAAQLQQVIAQMQATAAPRGPRPAAPSSFDGRSNALDTWKAEMLRQFAWYNTNTDAERIRIASAHLKDAASDWWQSLPAANRPTTWVALVAALESRFQPVNSAEIARTKLYALTQGKQTTSEYVDSFRRLLARIPDMGAPDQLHQFRRGLRPAIVMQLDVQTPPITALNDAINLAVRVGSRFDMAASSSSGSSSSNSGSSAPMELDNIEGLEGDTASDAADAPVTRAELKLLLAAMQDKRRQGAGGSSSSGGNRDRNGRFAGQSRGLPTIPHLTPEQVKEYMDAGKCFGCGSKDHRSRGCPKRKVGADGRVSWSN